MEALHARYPFTTAAREAVQAAEMTLGDVVTDRAPAVGRARERVLRAIEDGRVGPPRRPHTELLSYPVARVLVSIVGEPRLIRRYARAEADTAIERFREDLDAPERRSLPRDRLSLDALLDELDLSAHVEPMRSPDGHPDARSTAGYAVGIATYLDLATDLPDEDWRLVTRSVADGRVIVARAEFFTLLREAIRRRIEEGLPVEVPEDIGAALEEDVAVVREQLEERTPTRDIDAVEPALFPPCMTGLLGRLDGGERLPVHSRFALIAFLSTIGMTDEEIVSRVGAPQGDEDGVRSQVARLRADDGPSVYPPPACTTMQAYGDCDESIMDALCEQITHPLEYYERRLQGDDDVLQASSAESQ